MRILISLVLALSMAACQHSNNQESELAVLSKYVVPDVEMHLQQVSQHVYYVQGAAGAATENQGFISNSGAIVTPKGVIIVDALGSPALAAKMVSLLRKLTSQPIKRVILTHYHADHVYGLQVYKELGAEVYAPKGAMAYLRAPNAEQLLASRRKSLAPWVNDSTHLVKPDHIIDSTEEMELGGVKLTMNYVGAAHSDGDMTILVDPDRVLFSGDIIFEGRIAYLGDADTKHWLDILRGLQTKGLSGLIPGHGPAAKQPAKAIDQTVKYLAFVRKSMREAVDNFTPFEQAYEDTDWSEFIHLPAFDAANRRNAYQVYLSMEAESLKGQ